MKRVIEDQFQMFREKFGREPGPNDPVFFDPLADSPEFLGPEAIAILDDMMLQDMVKTRTPPEQIFAYLKTDRMVTEQNRQFLDDDELKEWDDAIEQYREDPRIQSAMQATIEQFNKKVV